MENVPTRTLKTKREDRGRSRRAKPAPPPPRSEPGELPETYDRTKVVAMVVSPYMVHVYWDLSPKDRAQTGPACLRFHDTTAGGSFDVPVDLASKNWYVHLWSPEKRYSIELGLPHAGEFAALARSNPIETPRAWPVTEVKQVSDPPVAAARLERPATEISRPPVSAAVSELTFRAFPGTPPPLPESPVSEHAAAAPPAAPPSPPPVRVDAMETLRRRLSELYGFRRWPRPVTPPPGFGAAEESVALLPVLGVPPVPMDLTAQLETQFSPGLSSVLLPHRNKPTG